MDPTKCSSPNAINIKLYRHFLAAHYADLNNLPAMGTGYSHADGALHRSLGEGSYHGIDIIQALV